MDVESSVEQPGRLETEMTEGGQNFRCWVWGRVGHGYHRNDSGKSGRTEPEGPGVLE